MPISREQDPGDTLAEFQEGDTHVPSLCQGVPVTLAPSTCSGLSQQIAGGSGPPQRPRNRADKICCTFFFFCLSVLFFSVFQIFCRVHIALFLVKIKTSDCSFQKRGCAKLRWLQQGPHILLSASGVALDSPDSRAFSDGLLLATDTPSHSCHTRKAGTWLSKP